MDKKKIIFKKRTNSIIIIAIISLIIGALAGIISAFYVTDVLIDQEGTSLIPLLQQKILHKSLVNKKNDSECLIPVITEEQKVVQVVERINSSVVNIIVSKDVSQYYNPNSPSFTDYFDDFFNFPFIKFNYRRIPTPVPEKQKQKQEVGGGIGFVISSEEGFIITNKHVVSDEEAEYTVVTNNGEKYEAEVLARDPFNDIAILKIVEHNLPEAKLGDSDQLKIGQTVITIGNALGEYRNTVTKCVVSRVGRKIIVGDGTVFSETLEGVIQTDAAINFGNSGGPLINLQGEVVGINTAIIRRGQLIGFAIPINQAKRVIKNVEKKYGRIIRPYLGVRYIIINEKIAKANKLPFDYGALIIRGKTVTDIAVIPGSPANKAGVIENDIILEMNNKKITETSGLIKEIQKDQLGEEVEFKIYHQGEEKIIKIVLEEYKE